MATMLDVSIRAGVSKATVSRVLNGTGQVKESTRQQVFKAMEELGYRPNFLARSLANRTSNSIGLVVSTFDGFYFGRLLQQASRQTEAWGKQLIVTDGHDARRGVEPHPEGVRHPRLSSMLLEGFTMWEMRLARSFDSASSTHQIGRAHV